MMPAISGISGATGVYWPANPTLPVTQDAPQEALKPRASLRAAPEFNGITTIGPQATTECKTCKNRRYQDQSTDSGVSMQSPTALTPGEAEMAVRSHEGEHVSRELSKAKSEGKTAYATVSIHTEICPECGKVYVSGGTTRVVTKTTEEVSPASDASKATAS